MKVYIAEDEWYPVYTPSLEEGVWEDAPALYEVDTSTLERWKTVMDAFDAVQKELSDIVHAVPHA